MRFLVVLAAFATVAAAPAPRSAPRVSLSPSVQKDVQCFVLFAAAVASAGNAHDDAARAASGLGVMYYLGKLQVGAPGLNLVAAVRQEADAFVDNPRVKDIGATCDAEFQKRGQELVDFGNQLQEPAAK